MANHYSALKRAQQTERRTVVNRNHTTRLRHQIRAMRRALKAGDAAAARPVLAQTIGMIDRAAQKGVIKKNTAARYKSRLSRRLRALESPKAA
ncbi:MAG: 30S ribosomal protein S20 [Acidobacteria bacterium]|nr:30S ribosomal protein S20 [Acidobacteriota bacterium]